MSPFCNYSVLPQIGQLVVWILLACLTLRHCLSPHSTSPPGRAQSTTTRLDSGWHVPGPSLQAHIIMIVIITPTCHTAKWIRVPAPADTLSANEAYISSTQARRHSLVPIGGSQHLSGQWSCFNQWMRASHSTDYLEKYLLVHPICFCEIHI